MLSFMGKTLSLILYSLTALTACLFALFLVLNLLSPAFSESAQEGAEKLSFKKVFSDIVKNTKTILKGLDSDEQYSSEDEAQKNIKALPQPPESFEGEVEGVTQPVKPQDFSDFQKDESREGAIESSPASGGQVGGGSVPEGQVEGGFVPEGQVEGGPVPEGQVGGGPVPEGQVGGGPVPEGQVGGGPVPGGQVGGGPVPEGQVGGGPVPEGQVGGGSVPEGQVGGGPVPEGQVGGGPVPGGQVGGGPVPEGQVGGGSVPEGQVGGGSVPEGQVGGGPVPGGQVGGGPVPGGQVGGGSNPDNVFPQEQVKPVTELDKWISGLSSEVGLQIQSDMASFVPGTAGLESPFEDPTFKISDETVIPRTPAEMHDLEDIRLRGIKWSTQNPKALFELPNDEGHYTLTKGDKIGRNSVIFEIREDEVVIVETIYKGLTEDQNVERIVKIKQMDRLKLNAD